MLLNRYRQYDIFFIRSILDQLKVKIDVTLSNDFFHYAKLKSFQVSYLEFMAPGSNKQPELMQFLDLLKGEQFLLLPLPLDTESFESISKEDALNELMEELDPKSKSDIKRNFDFFLEKLNVEEKGTFPLLFENKKNLKEFLGSENEDVEHYFIGCNLLFPVEMDWFLIFDYDIYVTHFIYQGDQYKDIRHNEKVAHLRYSLDEVNAIIAEYHDTEH